MGIYVTLLVFKLRVQGQTGTLCEYQQWRHCGHCRLNIP